MIDFEERSAAWLIGAYSEENLKIDAEHLELIKEAAKTVRVDKIELGARLIRYYDTKAYACHASEQKMREVYDDVFFGFNASAATFFAVCDMQFGLDKSQVSRLMNVVSEFGDASLTIIPKYQKYSWSALAEMLPLTPEERKPIKDSWTRKEIRDYKNRLAEEADEAKKEAVAPAQQENEDPDDQYTGLKPAKLRELLYERDARIAELEDELAELKEIMVLQDKAVI